MTVSCHSFAALARLCAPHRPEGGLFLCSPAATGVTGQAIYVDGGRHAVA